MRNPFAFCYLDRGFRFCPQNGYTFSQNKLLELDRWGEEEGGKAVRAPVHGRQLLVLRNKKKETSNFRGKKMRNFELSEKKRNGFIWRKNFRIFSITFMFLLEKYRRIS